MNTLIKTNDIRIAYKVTIWLLLSNNIAGITLNPKLFYYSLIFLIGIPGAVLIIHYFVSSLRKNPVMYFLPHLGALLFNGYILWMLIKSGIGHDIIGGAFWPSINLFLSAIALSLIIFHNFLNPFNNEN